MAPKLLMYIRLFLAPMLFFLLSYQSPYLFGEWLPGLAPEFLRPLTAIVAEHQHWLALLLLVTGLIMAVNRLIKISRWHYGKETTCDKCGCIADLRSGGYGSYRQCLGCGRRCKP